MQTMDFFHGRALQPAVSFANRSVSVAAAAVTVFWPLRNELAAVSNPPPPHFICCDSNPPTKRSNAQTDRRFALRGCWIDRQSIVILPNDYAPKSKYLSKRRSETRAFGLRRPGA